jgi:hypothetical protein
MPGIAREPLSVTGSSSRTSLELHEGRNPPVARSWAFNRWASEIGASDSARVYVDRPSCELETVMAMRPVLRALSR